MRLILLTFILQFIYLFCIAQSDADRNLKKYWFYKDRMNKFFLKKGNCYGCSLPASTLNIVKDNGTLNGDAEWGDAPDNLGYYIGQLASEYKLLSNSGQTQQANETLEELFYAINQVNYADNCEGHFPWNILAPGLNDKIDGFCMRDYGEKDNIFNSLKNGSSIMPPSQVNYNIPTDGTPRAFSSISGGYKDRNSQDPSPDYCPANFMSIDHQCYILLGLALVEKLIPDNTNINNNQVFLDGITSDFKTEAKLIAARFWSCWYRNNWRMVEPGGFEYPLAWLPYQCLGESHMTDFTQHPPLENAPYMPGKFNHYGQSGALLSYPFTKAVEEIVGGNRNIVSFIISQYGSAAAQNTLGILPSDLAYDLNVFKPFQYLLNSGAPVAQVNTLINNTFTSSFISQASYNFIYEMSSRELYYFFLTDLTVFNEISFGYVLSLECIADIYHTDAPLILAEWAYVGGAIGTLVEPGIGTAAFAVLAAGGAAIGIESSIYFLSGVYDWAPFYTTLHKVLHPNTGIIRAPENLCEEYLDGAPCSGTFKYNANTTFTNNTGEHGWANKRRWSASKKEQRGEEGGRNGTYAGTDFMLFFNLYCLRNDNYVPNYQNYLTGNFTVSGTIPYVAVQPMPIGDLVNIIGVDTYNPINPLVNGSPLNLRTFGKITSTAIIQNRAFDEDITAPLFNSTYSGVGSGIINFAIDWANNHGVIPTITLHVTTPTLQANVEFKATELIVLSPGFHAVNGVKFHAITTPPHCNSAGTDYIRAANPNNSSASSNTNYTKGNINSSSSSLKETSELTSSNSEIKNQDFNIVPNPNSGYFTLVLPSNKGDVSHFKINNMVGQTIFEKSTTENNVELSMENLPAGVYSVTNTTNNITKTRKMVVH